MPTDMSCACLNTQPASAPPPVCPSPDVGRAGVHRDPAAPAAPGADGSGPARLRVGGRRGALRPVRRGRHTWRGRAQYDRRPLRLLHQHPLPDRALVGQHDQEHRRRGPGGAADEAAQDSFCAATACVITRVRDKSGHGHSPGHQGPTEAGGSSTAATATREPHTAGGGKRQYLHINAKTNYWRDGLLTDVPPDVPTGPPPH